MNLQQQLARCQQHQQLLQLPHFNHETAWTPNPGLTVHLVRSASAQSCEMPD